MVVVGSQTEDTGRGILLSNITCHLFFSSIRNRYITVKLCYQLFYEVTEFYEFPAPTFQEVNEVAETFRKFANLLTKYRISQYPHSDNAGILLSYW